MIRVVFLGFGNVNNHFFEAFNEVSEISIIQIFNRSDLSKKNLKKSVPFTAKIGDLAEADVYVIGISDDAISGFSESLPFKGKLVVHTSGGVEMNALSGKNRRGVFYPLQTFSKNRTIDFKTVPICIEAENKADLVLLKKLGKSISETVAVISSEERASLHLAAVFANNFVNYFYKLSEEILEEKNLPFDLMKPLILETARKMETLSPAEAQTGPARRNDLKTIQKHLHLLENSPHEKLYELLTEAIKEKFMNRN